MKIMILSDLHHEIWGRTSRPVGEPILNVFPDIQRDLTILAGDIASLHNIGPVLQDFAKISPVMYVPGNHEYYGQEFHDFNKYLERIAAQLNNLWYEKQGHPVYAGPKVAFDLGGYRFVGSTLWTNFGGKPESEEMASKRIYDFLAIKVGEDKITPSVMKEFHEDHLAFMKECLAFGELPTVAVSHFVPTMDYIQEKWKKNPTTLALNHYFCNQLDYMMVGTSAPVMWVCGHTHDAIDKQHFNTRLVCNPKGYPNENFGAGDSRVTYQPLVVELP